MNKNSKLDSVNEALVKELRNELNPRKYIVYPCDFSESITIESAKRESDVNICIKVRCLFDMVIADFSAIRAKRKKLRKLLLKAIGIAYRSKCITDVVVSCELTDDLQSYCVDNQFKKDNTYDGYIKSKDVNVTENDDC